MWLVLGAGGQLGRCLGEALVEAGIPFTLTGRNECDITDARSVADVLSRTRPEVVVNCAAWTAVDAAEDNEADATLANRDGARNVAEACKDHGAQLVHVSTDYVFAGTDTGAYDEDSPTFPASAYGRTKLLGEHAVLESHPGGTFVVRTAWLYSRFGGNFVKTMLRRALADAPVRVVDDQRGQPTHAGDLARHIIDLVQSDAPRGVYHGTNSGDGTWCDLAREIYDLAHKPISLVSPVGTDEYPTKATRPKNSVLGHRRTVAAGVSEMRNWKSALAESIGGIIAEVEKENVT